MKSKRRLFLKNACAPVLFSIMGIPLIEACSKSEDSSDNSLDFASPPSSSGPIEIDIGSSKFNAIRSIGGWMNYVEENLIKIKSDMIKMPINHPESSSVNAILWCVKNNYKNILLTGITMYDKEVFREKYKSFLKIFKNTFPNIKIYCLFPMNDTKDIFDYNIII